MSRNVPQTYNNYLVPQTYTGTALLQQQTKSSGGSFLTEGMSEDQIAKMNKALKDSYRNSYIAGQSSHYPVMYPAVGGLPNNFNQNYGNNSCSPVSSISPTKHY
jgi:hypothetical protein